jgi:hypothetical protein
MREFSKYLFIFSITIFIASCSSNPADDMEPGVEYTYYDDGSCTERADRKCISKEQLNNICQSSNEFGVTKLVAYPYNTRPAFESIAKAKGVTTTVSVRDNSCIVLMETAGIYRGTQYNIKKACYVRSVTKSNSSGNIIVTDADSLRCMYSGL